MFEFILMIILGTKNEQNLGNNLFKACYMVRRLFIKKCYNYNKNTLSENWFI